MFSDAEGEEDEAREGWGAGSGSSNDDRQRRSSDSSSIDTPGETAHIDQPFPPFASQRIPQPSPDIDAFEQVSLPDDDSDGEEVELTGPAFESIGSEELPTIENSSEAYNGVHYGHISSIVRQGERIVKQYQAVRQRKPSLRAMDGGGGGSSNTHDYDPNWQQAGPDADPQDLAGPGLHCHLDCTVSKPQREGEGTQNSYVSYLVTTDTDFKSFQSAHSQVRRRFTDFVFLHKSLTREYPQCAVPPLPDKQNMTHMGLRGDRFSPDFMARRAYSLSRFLSRLALHPVLRRATILTLFLESTDWNGIMKSRPTRAMSGSGGESGGQSSVLESWTDTFLNAFSKPHRTDKKFTDVSDRANKLSDDLSTVSKTVARVSKREADLETDYADLATQFQKLAALEPGVQDELTRFAASVTETSEAWRELKEHTDQNYLGSLKDMESYAGSMKSLLKTREQKQLDFEGLTDYLAKAASERDMLASHHGSVGASGFLRQKIEDVRGVDHEQSRRERQRKLEVQISRLKTETETAQKTSEAFDLEVMKEVGDFERIKAVEFRSTLGGLAEKEIEFFERGIEVWERFVKEMEGGAMAGAGVEERRKEAEAQVA